MARSYRSTRRAEQAAATRRLIVDAARRVLAERGYAGTTIAAIAEAADVAVPTVYASVGGKAAILAALHDRVDEDTGVPATVEAVAATSRPEEVLHIAIELTQRIAERFGDMLHVLEGAAPSEPDAATTLSVALQRHRNGVRLIAGRLADLYALRADLSVEDAADTLAILTTWRTWWTLTVDFGWSWPAASVWVEQTASRAVLRAQAVAPPSKLLGRI